MLVAIRGVLRGDAMVSPSVTRRLLERFVFTPGRTRGRRPARRADRTRAGRGSACSRRACPTRRSPAGCTWARATVKTHVGRVLSKLALRDRVHAVVFAYESGLIRPGS